ncbi:MAG: hypothetical protein ACXVNF_00945 [Neobacillus sp.]
MLDIPELTTKNEAITAISNFFKKVNKNSYETNEALRILVDEKKVISKCGCSNIAECVEKYSQTDWSEKTIYAHLNVGRMVHAFKKIKVLIPQEISYTTLRTLNNAFNNKNKAEQLNLQLEAWNIADSNKEGKYIKKADIESAIKEINSKLNDSKVVSIKSTSSKNTAKQGKEIADVTSEGVENNKVNKYDNEISQTNVRMLGKKKGVIYGKKLVDKYGHEDADILAYMLEGKQDESLNQEFDKIVNTISQSDWRAIIVGIDEAIREGKKSKIA